MLIPHKVKNKGKYISFHYLRGWKARKIRKVQEISPQISIYIDLGNWDLTAKKFLNSQHLSGYIRYELNNNFSIILFKGEGNSVIYITLPTMNIPIFEACYLQNISLLNDWWQSSDDLLELYSFIMKTVKAHTSIKTNFVPQSYPTPSKKSLQSP